MTTAAELLCVVPVGQLFGATTCSRCRHGSHQWCGRVERGREYCACEHSHHIGRFAIRPTGETA